MHLNKIPNGNIRTVGLPNNFSCWLEDVPFVVIPTGAMRKFVGIALSLRYIILYNKIIKAAVDITQ